MMAGQMREPSPNIPDHSGARGAAELVARLDRYWQGKERFTTQLLGYRGKETIFAISSDLRDGLPVR